MTIAVKNSFSIEFSNWAELTINFVFIYWQNICGFRTHKQNPFTMANNETSKVRQKIVVFSLLFLLSILKYKGFEDKM